MASIEEFLEFYQGRYKKAYAEVVGFLNDKPSQLLVEIENINAHLINFIDPHHSSRQENLDKAYNHLVRITIDCHKLLWVALAKKIIEIKRTPGLKDVLSVSMAQFVSAIIMFKRISVAARNIEMDHVGSDPTRCLEAYSKAIYMGAFITELLDSSKLADILPEDMPAADYIAPYVPEYRDFEAALEEFSAAVELIENPKIV